jgi:hypothetical protein
MRTCGVGTSDWLRSAAWGLVLGVLVPLAATACGSDEPVSADMPCSEFTGLGTEQRRSAVAEVQATTTVPPGSITLARVDLGCATDARLTVPEVLAVLARGDEVAATTTAPPTTTTTAPPTTAPPQTSPPQTSPPEPEGFEPGDSFEASCTIAWPSAPTRDSETIQMLTTCSGVPTTDFQFVQVVYPDPNLEVTPSTGAMRVEGEVYDIAESEIGYRVLIVLADDVEL